MLCCGSTSRRQEAITPSPPRLSTPSKGDRYWNDGPPMSSPSIRWAIECMLMLWIIERTVTIDWPRIIGGLHNGMGRARRGWGMADQKGRTGQNPAERFKYLLRLLTLKGPGSEVTWRPWLTVWCFLPPPTHTYPTYSTELVQSTLFSPQTHIFSISLALCPTLDVSWALSWLTVWLFTIACISQIWDTDTWDRLFMLREGSLSLGNRQVVLYYSEIVSPSLSLCSIFILTMHGWERVEEGWD